MAKITKKGLENIGFTQYGIGNSFLKETTKSYNDGSPVLVVVGFFDEESFIVSSQQKRYPKIKTITQINNLLKTINMAKFKTISELRLSLNFNTHQINSQIKYFANDVTNIDFDVFLKSRGFNLQRDYVWTIEQKRELIWSVLMNRHIPKLSMMNIWVDRKDTNGKYLIIDGKQRLSAMIDFYKNKYTLLVDNEEFYFKELPKDYQNVIGGYWFQYDIAHEPEINTFTDEDKMEWFKLINFAGTPQDKTHLNKIFG